MLAAGVGVRLESTSPKPPPKVLLRFGGKSLLEHHLQILKRQGIDELVLGVGYQCTEIERELCVLGAHDFVRTVFNEDYRKGNIVTLWTLRDELCCGDTVLLMDADILYDEELPRRLINSSHRNCLLLDRNFAPGDEPVKICIRNGEIIEFRKWLRTLIEITFPTSSWTQFVIPVAVELVSMKRQGIHLRVRCDFAGRVLSLVELGFDPKPGGGSRSAYQVDNGLEGT